MSEFAKLDEICKEGEIRSGVYCVLCSKSMREDTWDSHSSTASHASNAEHFDLLFEPRQGAGLVCNFCGESVSWDVIKQHEKQHFLIPWDKSEDKYDKYKIFFENFIVEWKNSYACYACGLTFGEWSTALVHIVDSEHQARSAKSQSLEDTPAEGTPSYEFLVKEGLVATDSSSSLECTVCQGCSVSLDNALRHVQGLAHMSNASRHSFDFRNVRNDQENEDTSLRDQENEDTWLRDQENEDTSPRDQENEDTWLRDQENEDTWLRDQENEDTLPRDQENEDTSLRDEENEDTSLRDQENEDTLPRDQENEDTSLHDQENEDTWLHDQENEDTWLRDEENEDTSPRDKENEDTWLRDQEDEDTSLRNQENEDTWLRDQENEDTWLRDQENEDTSPRDEENEDTSPRDEENEDTSPRDQENEDTWLRDQENEDTWLCDYVAKKSYRTYRCVICECEFDAELKAEHIAGAMHSASLKLHRCHAVTLLSGKYYYCQACDYFIRGLADVYEHVKEKKHCSHVDNEDNVKFNWLVTDDNITMCVVCKCVVTCRDHLTKKYHENSLKIHGCDDIDTEAYKCRACALAFANIEEIHRHVIAPAHLKSLSVKIKDSRDFSHYIVNIDENDCRCVLCSVDLAASEISVERHVAGTAHAQNIERHGCRSVSKIGNDVYYCGACRSAFRGRWEVYSHVKVATHLCLARCAAKLTSREEEITKNTAVTSSRRLLRFGNDEIVQSEEECAINATERLPCVGRKEDILRRAQREAQLGESKGDMSMNAATVASKRLRSVGKNGNMLTVAQREAQQIASMEEIPKNTAETASKRLPHVGTNEILQSEASGEAQREAQREAQHFDSTKEILKNAVQTLSMKSAPIGWKKQVLQSLAQQEAHHLDTKKEFDEEMSNSDAEIVPVKLLRVRTNEKILQSIAQRGAQRVDSTKLFDEEMTKSATETIPTKSHHVETIEKVLQSKAKRGAQHLDSKLEVSIKDLQTILTESAPIGTKKHSHQSIAQQGAQHNSIKKLKTAAQEVSVKLSSAQRAAQQLEKKEKEETPKNAAQKIPKKSPSGTAKEILQMEAQRAAQQLEKKEKEETPKKAAQKIPKKSPSCGAKENLRMEAQRAVQQLEKKEKEETPKNAAQKIPKKSPSCGAKEILRMEAQRAAQQLEKKEKEETPKKAAQKIPKKSPSGTAKEILRMEAQRAAQQLEKEEIPRNAAQIIPKKLPTAGTEESKDTGRSKAQRAAQQLDAKNQSKEETPKNVAQKISMELSTAGWKESKERGQSKAQRATQRLEKKENEETSNGEEDNFTRDYVVKIWDKMYFCLLCECPVHPEAGNYESHVNGRVHNEAARRHGCDRIKFANDAYRCDRCDLEMRDFQDVWLHVKDTSHLDRVDANEEETTVNSQNTEAILYYVNVYEDKRAYCEICECELSLSHGNITYHVMGKAHAKSRREFGCENIEKLTDLTYRCNCCDYAINNMADVYTHVKSSNHLTLARKKTVEIKPKVVETKKSFLTSNGESNVKMAKSAKKKMDSNNPMEQCNTNDIVAIEVNKYFCHCCNCTIHGEANFYGHARGKRHFAALLKRSTNDS